MFDSIERLKSEWTDKYVVIHSRAPELARFADATGIVKTVNMNGSCLVEFDQFNNTGWYDIDPSALKMVAKPLPKPAEAKAKPTPAKPAPAKAISAKTAAPAKPAAAAGKRPSTADILAAARAKAGGAATPAAAKPAGKPSTADILAAARGKKAPAAAAGSEPAAPVAEAPEPEATPVAEPVVESAKPAPPAGPLPTTTAEKIAWCRARDAKALIATSKPRQSQLLPTFSLSHVHGGPSWLAWFSRFA